MTTKKLSEYIVRTRVDDFSDKIVDAAKKILLDWIGCALGAADDPSVKAMADFLFETGGKRQASIFGSGRKTSVLHAALLNGMMSHVLDFDDANSLVRTHPSAPLVPALLAIAEGDRRPGMDLIAPLVVGYEVTIRIGLALGRQYYEAGRHATSVLGRFGAAAGVGKLLGLNADRMCRALALSATQAGGLRDVFGTMAKPFHAGKAAMDGLLSATLAERGLSAPLDILDETSGFARVFSREYDPGKITVGLGGNDHILSNSFKPYAACLLAHPVIDALVEIKREHRLDAATVAGIHVEVAPLNMKVAGNPYPRDSTEAKFSIPFGAAVALIRGSANESDFKGPSLQDSAARTLMESIRVSVNPSLSETETHATVVLKDGSTFEKHVSTPKGDPLNPLTFEEVEAKFRGLAEPVIGTARATKIVEMITRLERLNDSARLVRLCCTRGRETDLFLV
jgi:2-methylcitrate dehydratase PrpD